MSLSSNQNQTQKRYVVFGNPPSTLQLRSIPISDCSPWTWLTPSQDSSPSPPPQPPLPPPAIPTASRHVNHPTLQPVVSTDSGRPSSPDPNQPKRPLPQTPDSPQSPDQSLDSTKRRKTNAATSGEDEASMEDSTDDSTRADFSNMNYYEDQLDYRDGIGEESTDSSLLSSSEKEETSCFLANLQGDKSAPQAPEEDPPEQTPELTITESLVYNLPEFYFDARCCTPLDRLAVSSTRRYHLLFLLTDKKPCMTIQLKKPRRDGVTSVELAHFECLDESGAPLKIAIWGQTAEELEPPCFVGDIIYLSEIAISTYQGIMQGSTTKSTRVQICYRLKPTHFTHVDRYQKDLRLAYDPTTRRVKQLVEWARRIYDE